MVADVPLGAFLSGGVDSSAIVALMQRFATSSVRTFSIGFREREFDEAGYARAVARHLGTDHTELYLGAEDAIGVIEKLPEIYSEPFGDSSQIPTVLVSRLARQDVTVALSGDGGDELLAGYRRYSWARKLWSYTKVVPPGARGLIAKLAYAVTPQQWDQIWALLKPFLPSTLKVARPGYRVHKAASFYSARTFSDLYLSLISVWDEAASAVINGQEPTTVYSSRECWPSGVSALEEMLWLDTVSYLPDDILVKVDRAAMAVGLETRIPLLDHRLVEFVWGLPTEVRAHQSESKWLLRRLLLKYIPAELIDRPKMGFGVPIGDWLKGPLRDWAEELLSENRLSREGFFYVALVRQKWSQHLKGERNWQYLLWHLLMFQQWYRHTKTNVGKDL
jgi:asparagine synthase (glutamine-hydrolysing)